MKIDFCTDTLLLIRHCSIKNTNGAKDHNVCKEPFQARICKSKGFSPDKGIYHVAEEEDLNIFISQKKKSSLYTSYCDRQLTSARLKGFFQGKAN